MITVLEISNKTDADAIVAAINQKKGLPIQGNVTQTWCEVIENNGKYYLNKDDVPQGIDTSKAVEKVMDSIQDVPQSVDQASETTDEKIP